VLGLAKDEIADEDEDFSFEERELQRIANSVESPLSAYARYLARLDTVNPFYANILRVRYPVTKLVKADIMYARKTWKNRLFMLNGSPGTFKSFSAITMCDWLDQNGFWTHNKGNYDLPKLFFNTIDLMGYLQSDAKLGDCLIGGTIITMADGSKRTISELMKMSKLGIRNFAFKTYNIIRKVPELGIGWVRTAGRKRTMKVTFDDGTELVGTSNHKVLLKNYKYVTLQKLKFDDEVIEV